MAIADKVMKFCEAKVLGVNKRERSVTGLASVKEVDAIGDLMLPSAFEKRLARFKKNPVLLWCHDMASPPIGQVVDFVIEETGVRFKAIFDKDPFSDLIFRKYESGTLRAFSVQFKTWGERSPEASEVEEWGEPLQRVLTDVELYELSSCPVPAVASALAGKSLERFDRSMWEELTRMIVKQDEPAPGEPGEEPPAEPAPSEEPGEPEEETEEEGQAAGLIAEAAELLTAAQDALVKAQELLGEPEEEEEPPEGEGEGAEPGEAPPEGEESEAQSLSGLLKGFEDRVRTNA